MRIIKCNISRRLYPCKVTRLIEVTYFRVHYRWEACRSAGVSVYASALNTAINDARSSAGTAYSVERNMAQPHQWRRCDGLSLMPLSQQKPFCSGKA